MASYIDINEENDSKSLQDSNTKMDTADEKRITLEDHYIYMLDEASQVEIPPPQQEVLKYYGFHGIYLLCLIKE